jgi:hypothetical protein
MDSATDDWNASGSQKFEIGDRNLVESVLADDFTLRARREEVRGPARGPNGR